MCDEHDDERMRELWRRLAMQEASSDVDEERSPLGEALARPAAEVVPSTSRKARALPR